jgi:hypothetical protein
MGTGGSRPQTYWDFRAMAPSIPSTAGSGLQQRPAVQGANGTTELLEQG